MVSVTTDWNGSVKRKLDFNWNCLVKLLVSNSVGQLLLFFDSQCICCALLLSTDSPLPRSVAPSLFHCRLKTSFFTDPSHHSLVFLLLLLDWLRGFSGLLPILMSVSVFILFLFFFHLYFLIPCDRWLRPTSGFERTLTYLSSYHIVSYYSPMVIKDGWPELLPCCREQWVVPEWSRRTGRAGRGSPHWPAHCSRRTRSTPTSAVHACVLHTATTELE